MKYPQCWQMRWGGGVSLWSCCGVACLQHLFPPPTPSSWTIHLLINQDHADDDGDGGGDCGHRVVTLKTKLIVTTNTSLRLCVAAYNDRAGHEYSNEFYANSSHKICCIRVTIGISLCHTHILPKLYPTAKQLFLCWPWGGVPSSINIDL